MKVLTESTVYGSSSFAEPKINSIVVMRLANGKLSAWVRGREDLSRGPREYCWWQVREHQAFVIPQGESWAEVMRSGRILAVFYPES